MTPIIWHKLSLKLEPYRSKLKIGLIICLGLFFPIFGYSAYTNTVNEFSFLALWIITIPVFWIGGFLGVIDWFKDLPEKKDKLNVIYYGKYFMSWYVAIFLVLWFLSLIVISFWGTGHLLLRIYS